MILCVSALSIVISPFPFLILLIWILYLFSLKEAKHLSGGSDGKESSCNIGDLGLIPGFQRFPWRWEQLPTPVFWPREFHGRRNPVCYSPWVTKSWTWLSNFHFTLFIWFIFSNNAFLVSLIFAIVFFISISFISPLIYMISSL